MGLPGIGFGGVVGAMTGIGPSLQAQAIAAMNPTVGPPVPNEIAMAAPNAAMIANTDVNGTGYASKGVGLSGLGLDGGGKMDGGMGFGGSVSCSGLADGGGKAGGAEDGQKGDAGTGVGSEGPGGGDKSGWRHGGYTGDGADDWVQVTRPAGTVHEGEVVIPAEMVRRYGLQGLLALVNGAAPRGLLG